MELSEVIFVESLPKLDLHGYDRETATVAINDFINDNIKMGNEIINIVHGIGKGIIREETLKTLSKNKKVLDYKNSFPNRGSTIVKIIKEK